LLFFFFFNRFASGLGTSWAKKSMPQVGNNTAYLAGGGSSNKPLFLASIQVLLAGERDEEGKGSKGENGKREKGKCTPSRQVRPS
jgi:hypothetical protein